MQTRKNVHETYRKLPCVQTNYQKYHKLIYSQCKMLTLKNYAKLMHCDSVEKAN